jgi:hypothetical protein
MRYEGSGVFRCLRPKLIEMQPGEVHGWQLAEARSKATHDHFFACINDAWMNLPEELADDFPSAEHLRKWSLIKAGFCTMTTVVCATNADAVLLAAKARELDRYSMVEVAEDEKSPLKTKRIVRIWTADSQRRDAMGRKIFQEAKERALQVISELIGTDITTLRKAAGNAA